MRSVLLTSSVLLGIGLSACDPKSSTSPTETGGEIAFRLSSADSLSVAGTVDSIAVRAFSGRDTVEARAAFGRTVTLKGLAAGSWSLHANLFESSGIVRWAGTETVQVRSGETTAAKLVLMPATGSIRVEVELAKPKAETVDFYATTGSNFPYQAFVKNWNDSIPLLGGVIRSLTDFDSYFGAAGVMWATRPYTPTESDFATYDYVLAARVVNELGGFATDSVRRSGNILSVYYTFETKPVTSARYHDFIFVRIPKRLDGSIDTLRLYENRKLVVPSAWVQ